MKIYIIPSGWDRELVVKTVFKSRADKVCLISAHKKEEHTYSKSDLITRDINTYLVQELSKFTKVEILEVNYIDFKDIAVHINDYLHKNKGNEFVINISTGSRMLAATLMVLGYMHGIDIDYSIAENHNPKIMQIIEEGGDYHCGFSEILRVPSIPFSLKFSVKEKHLLLKLKEHKILSVKDFVNGAKGNAENRLRSEFHYLCRKLERQGFLKIVSNKTKFEVKLTPFGELCV